MRRQGPTWVYALLHCTHTFLHTLTVFLTSKMDSFRFPHMVLSLTMLSVPSPTECVLMSGGMLLSHTLKSPNRLEAYFHTCDELLHMWAHAEDLDTLEFTLMQVITYIAGPVRIPAVFATCSCCSYNPGCVHRISG